MTTPLETNARKLIGVLVQHFPGGGTSEDLRRSFEREPPLVRQSFYNALKYAKEQGWIVGGGRDQLYNLNPDGSWKMEHVTSIGENLEKDRLEHLVGMQAQRIGELHDEVEHLRDFSGGANGADVAVSTLVQIVGDSNASPRQRIKASGAILGYRVQDDTVIKFVEGFLKSLCADSNISTDYRIEAGELLRKHEAPRIASESVRPSYSDDGGTEANRIEAWRTFERWQLRREIMFETRDPPRPGWDLELMAESYQPPAQGWPPVRVVTDPTSGFRLLDNLMPGPGPRKLPSDVSSTQHDCNTENNDEQDQ